MSTYFEGGRPLSLLPSFEVEAANDNTRGAVAFVIVDEVADATSGDIGLGRLKVELGPQVQLELLQGIELLVSKEEAIFAVRLAGWVKERYFKVFRRGRWREASFPTSLFPYFPTSLFPYFL
jgi:hypothetical protein